MPLPAGAALLVVDVQQGLDDPRLGARNNPDAERRVAELLAAWRAAAWPVVHVQHLSRMPFSPLRPELPGCAIKPEARPQDGEPLFQKHVNAAFVDTGLEGHLRDREVEAVVVVGLATDHCVSSTVRMASDLGFDVTLVADATAAYDREGPDGTRYDASLVHAVTLASLHGEFASVRTARDVLADLRGAAAA